jgi:hypothetical protein
MKRKGSPLYLQSRRTFLENSLKSAAALSLVGSASIREAAAAASTVGARRYLVNFMVWGGVDTCWWFDNVPFRYISDVSRVYIPGMTPDNGAITMDLGQTFRDPVGNIFANFKQKNSGVKWDQRHPDSFLRAHPVTPHRYLGPGLSGFSNADLSSIAFVSGIQQGGGGHFLGNRYIQTGTSGKATPCFSALIAQHLASQYVRPLHYVQIANNPDELYNQPGNLIGPAMPIQIPKMSAWQQITSFSPSDLDSSRRAMLSATLDRLSNQIGSARLRKATSRSLYSSFFNSFSSAATISQGGAAASPEFTSTLAHYRQFLHGAGSATAGILGSSEGHVFRSWFSNRLLPSGSLASSLYNELDQLAFQLAMAEYLIVNDLSAVIDLPTLGLDYHNDSAGEAGRVLGIMMGFRELMRRLKAQPYGSGSLFDCTTFALHTEFTRSPFLNHEATEFSIAGSGHWEGWTSMMLAGAGVSGNKMVGGYMTSPTAIDSPYRGNNLEVFSGLPINPASGLPDFGPNGRMMTTEQIFPTLLSIFGCSHLNPLTNGVSPITSVLGSGSGSVVLQGL